MLLAWVYYDRCIVCLLQMPGKGKRLGAGKGRQPAKKSRAVDDEMDAGATGPVPSASPSVGESVVAVDDELPVRSDSRFNAGVASHLEEPTVAKIVQGRYVQFNTLLSGYRPVEKLMVSRSGEAAGSLTTAPATRKLYNFSEWLDAYIVYASVRGGAHPGEMPDLWKYLSHVKRIHARGGNFVAYDESFRCKHRGEAVIPWGQLDSEEMSWAVGDPGYVPYEQYVKVKGPQKGQLRSRAFAGSTRVSNAGICFSYNKGRRCLSSPCRFSHKCQACGAPHPITSCSTTKGGRKGTDLSVQ